MSTGTFQTKQKSNRNSILELVKLAFAFMVLKGHNFTPLIALKDCNWFGSAGIAVEFFFCIAGWFLIKGIISHQEKYGHLGMWRSWWKLFVKKIALYAIPCIIPGFVVNIITLFYDGGCPNGILWMYYFVHEIILVTFIYYVVYFKIKDENKRLKITIAFAAGGLAIRFAFRALAITNTANLETLLEFWRALSFMSIGALCARIPKLKTKSWILWIFCILSVAGTMLLVTFPIPDIWKEVGYTFAYPLMIYCCLLVNFSFKPFDYCGQISKGLYLWQMIPWMFNVIGLYYKVDILSNRWFLMGIAFALPIVEDAIRRIIKHVKAKNFDPVAYKAKLQAKEERATNIYLNKQHYFVLLIVLASCLVGVGIAYGCVGLSKGGIQDFSWFVDKDGRLTYHTAIILTLIFTAPIPVQLAINWKLQHNALLREKEQWKKN